MAELDRNEVAERLGMEYLDRLPMAVPEGKRLVHNNIRPSRRQGSNGARYWLASPDAGQWPRLVVCGCGWASELGAHYRVATAGHASQEDGIN